MLLSVPYKLLVYLLGLPEAWAIGQPLLFGWLLSLNFLLKKYKLWRADKEEEGTYTRNKLLEEFVIHLEWELRWTLVGGWGFFTLWIFQIEHFFELHQPGYAFCLFYFIVCILVIRGCINEYRVNDF